jgi:hypothetical protein
VRGCVRRRGRAQPFREGRSYLLGHGSQAARGFSRDRGLGIRVQNRRRALIRTIEYWDIERRRYPAYDHRAVLIAEDITTRFLNVITLFSGSIPIIAIQVKGNRRRRQYRCNFFACGRQWASRERRYRVNGEVVSGFPGLHRAILSRPDIWPQNWGVDGIYLPCGPIEQVGIEKVEA